MQETNIIEIPVTKKIRPPQRLLNIQISSFIKLHGVLTPIKALRLACGSIFPTDKMTTPIKKHEILEDSMVNTLILFLASTYEEYIK